MRDTGAAAGGQRGMVLLVVLVMLTMLSIVSLQAMDSSALEARMAVADADREIGFQAAETVLERGRRDRALFEAAYAGHLRGADPALPARDFALGDSLRGQLVAAFVDEAPPLGHDIVLGGAGLRRLHFEIRATVARGAGQPESRHLQGISYLAPRLP